MGQERLAQISSHLRPSNASAPYVVKEEPLGTARQVRIITIGAGASGLNVIHTLRKQLTNYEHVVYEKNPEVGGTWYENRHPGCKCDIPSHNYQFTWKPNPQWSEFFSSAQEIEEYLCGLCDEDMRKEIKTEHEVAGAHWNEESGTWKVRVMNLATGVVFHDYCHFLLNAGGILK
jgi:cation diffusion facilitator CzcD-associated flavoprotein CzcO